MRNLLLASLERAAPRLGAAIISLAAAAILSPSVVGLYVWVILMLSLLLSIFDSAVRQIAVFAVRNEKGMNFLRRYTAAYALIGPTTIGLTILTLTFAADPAPNVSQVLSLSIFCFAPLFTAFATVHVARLQAIGRWRSLASIQSTAVMSSLTISLPLLITTRNLLAICLQVTLAEALNFIMLRQASLRHQGIAGFKGADVPFSTREFLLISLYSALSWAQGQADRVAVGMLAGQADLAKYVLGQAVGRNGSEALSASTANVFRAEITDTHTLEEQRRLVERAMIRSVILTASVAVAVTVLAKKGLNHILDADWHEALQMVPVLASAGILSVLSSLLTVLIVLRQNVTRALPIRIVSVAAALPIGWAATQDLRLAANAFLARELVVMALLWATLGRGRPTRGPLVGVCAAAALLLFDYLVL